MYVKVGFFEGFLSFFMLVRFFLLVCGWGIFVFGRLRRVFMWCGVGFFFLMFSGFVKKLFCGWKLRKLIFIYVYKMELKIGRFLFRGRVNMRYYNVFYMSIFIIKIIK